MFHYLTVLGKENIYIIIVVLKQRYLFIFDKIIQIADLNNNICILVEGHGKINDSRAQFMKAVKQQI